jgi:hypothetical protein
MRKGEKLSRVTDMPDISHGKSDPKFSEKSPALKAETWTGPWTMVSAASSYTAPQARASNDILSIIAHVWGSLSHEIGYSILYSHRVLLAR